MWWKGKGRYVITVIIWALSILHWGCFTSSLTFYWWAHYIFKGPSGDIRCPRYTPLGTIPSYLILQPSCCLPFYSKSNFFFLLHLIRMQLLVGGSNPSLQSSLGGLLKMYCHPTFTGKIATFQAFFEASVISYQFLVFLSHKLLSLHPSMEL